MRLYAAILEDLGYRILDACDVPEALKLLDREGKKKIDIVFTPCLNWGDGSCANCSIGPLRQIRPRTASEPLSGLGALAVYLTGHQGGAVLVALAEDLEEQLRTDRRTLGLFSVYQPTLLSQIQQ